MNINTSNFIKIKRFNPNSTGAMSQDQYGSYVKFCDYKDAILKSRISEIIECGEYGVNNTTDTTDTDIIPLIQQKSDTFYSVEDDIDQMEEECAELIVALKKFKRGINCSADVLNEMCDVSQLLDKFIRKEYFGDKKAFDNKSLCKYLKMEGQMVQKC